MSHKESCVKCLVPRAAVSQVEPLGGDWVMRALTSGLSLYRLIAYRAIGRWWTLQEKWASWRKEVPGSPCPTTSFWSPGSELLSLLLASIMMYFLIQALKPLCQTSETSSQNKLFLLYSCLSCSVTACKAAQHRASVQRTAVQGLTSAGALIVNITVILGQKLCPSTKPSPG
jgi:hypothetical protein